MSNRQQRKQRSKLRYEGSGSGSGARGPGGRGSYRARKARSLPLLPIAVGVVLVLIGVGIFVYARASSSSSGSQQGQSQANPTVDGIQCQGSEQLAYHIHSHLAIYADGSQRPVSEGVGIAQPQQVQQTQQGPFVAGGSCLYWLHTHDSSGIIHVESPQQRTYTLGDFFDIWGQTLSPQQVGSSKGTVVAYVNGQQYSGNPRNIQLTNHAAIQLDVGQPTPPQPYTFPSDL
jgi:hypothetical protein